MHLSKIQFAGEQFIAIKDEQNIVWVALRPVAEYLGLSWSSALQKVRDESRFNCVVINTTGKDGKRYEMWCMPVKKLRHWLFTISPNKVREAVKDKLIRYQDELCDIIDDYFERRYGQRRLFGDVPESDLRPITKLLSKAYVDYVNNRRTEDFMGRDRFKTEAIKFMGAYKDGRTFVVEVDRFNEWMRRLSLRLY